MRAWLLHLPKPVRFVVRCMAGTLYVCLSPLWMPVMIVLWVICSAVLSLHKLWEEA